MTDYACNQTLTTGANDGSDWNTNAFQTLATALDGVNVVAGDRLFVKNNETAAGILTLKGVAGFTTDPPQVIACKPATTTFPPAQSDLIPGLRTGQSVLAYADGDAPTLTVTTAGAELTVYGYMQMYGLVLKARDNFHLCTLEGAILMEECDISAGNGEIGVHKWGSGINGLSFIHLKNCKIGGSESGQVQSTSRPTRVIFENCVLDMPQNGMVLAGSGQYLFDGCDFSAQTGAILGDAGGRSPSGSIKINNCKINASSALTTGSINEKFRAEFTHTSSATGKTTGGSFREIDIITDNGMIVEDTTHFRTDGADDGGSGAWALAYTPNVNGTRDNREGLVGPWFNQKIAGDGTAQTLTVFIANDLAEDAGNTYDDDDVWLEVFSPEAAEGAADYDFATTQMDLLATPAEITTETASTWGSGANNRQKLSVSISPDYTGRLRWRVVFAKNFGATPDTLYVDPASEIT